MGSRIVDISEVQSPMIRVTRRLRTQGLGIIWAGMAVTCDKQLRHYPAFTRNETTIFVNSFVFVAAAKGKRDYVGYLIDLYADKRGNKKANVRWFCHNQETSGVISNLEFDPREIFMTPDVETINVDCIEGFAVVLTPTDYEKCLDVVSLEVSSQVYMCSRQILDNYELQPFSVRTLPGYTCQRILSCIDWPRTIEVELGNNEVDKEPANNLKIKLSIGGNIDLNKSLDAAPFEPGQMIEVLSQDSGLRGWWFRCKILETTPKNIKIQYVDVCDAEDSTYLEESISASQVAAVDILGMRFSGRPTIRPYPNPKDIDGSNYEIGSPVDAWWSNGWWEGFVVGTAPLQVYAPGEMLTLTVQVKDLRISRDWVGDKWDDIKMANKDVLTCISSKGVGIDENVVVAGSLKPLQIGGGKKKVNKRGESGAVKGSYFRLN